MALQDADTAFLMQDHKRQFSVSAGAELIATIERDQGEQLADLAALCLVCGGAQSVHTGVPDPDMPKAAARYIESRTCKRASAASGTGGEAADSKIQRLESELTIVAEESNMLWCLVSSAAGASANMAKARRPRP